MFEDITENAIEVVFDNRDCDLCLHCSGFVYCSLLSFC
jgi:hypothetical protein